MTAGSPSVVACRGLTKRFGGTAGVTAVDGLDLDVPAGSVFGLLGPNGAGKTTTLRLITGLARPTGGTVTIDGRPVTADGSGGRAGIGVLDQDPRYYGWMSGLELVELAGRLQGLAATEARASTSRSRRRASSPRSAPARQAKGSRMAAPRAVRAKTITAGERSSTATLMSR